MEKSKQIQIGLLAAIVLLLLLNVFGAFDGIMGGSSDSDREEARTSLSPSVTANTNPAAANTPTATPAEPAAPAGPTTSVEFAETSFNFGTVDAGEKVNHTYKFKNTGSEPLIISNAKGSCGCTVPSWPKEPIPPGASGEIQVQFDSKNKKGKQTKRVTITANTEPVQTFLEITGEVNGADPVQAAPAPASK
ncbi:MAG: DUF1573 domain-containing protein [Bacteroidota bacterium]